MMYSCKQVSNLLSDGLDRRLRPMQRFGLRIHLALCQGCARVERQLIFLRSAVSELPKRRHGADESGRK